MSIVTIVYNGEKYLEQTIESVLGQSYPHIEYIIIDGGSTDNSTNIIEKYRSRLAYFISEKDRGVSDAFNKGILQAKGEIIGLINADDWYEKDTVEKMVAAMEHHDVGYGDVRYWKEGKPDMIVVGNHEYMHHEMSVNHPTVFIKSAAYHKLGLFDLHYKYAMDYELLLRLWVAKVSFVHVPGVAANMRWEGLSDRHWRKAVKEAWAIKDRHLPDRKLMNRLFFHKQVSAIKLSRFLHRMYLQRAVRFYRSRFSPLRKKYQ